MQKLYFAYLRILSEGFLWAILEITKRLIKFNFYIILLPAIFLLRFMGYRFLNINAARIGHLAGEIDCFVKLRTLGFIDTRYKYIIFSKSIICNQVLWHYVKKNVNTIDNKYICKLLDLMTIGPGIKFDISNYILSINQSAKYYDVCRLWSGRDPVFLLEENHYQTGSAILREMGIPINSQFVCIHVRTKGYFKGDESVHEHRNFSSDSVLKAISEIVNRGYYCVIMGDVSAPNFIISDRVKNYAHSQFKSDLMDVFLCANAKFFLGNSSGLFILSTVFGVPCALCNMLPFTCTGFTYRDLSIPKLIRKLSDGSYLNYHEIIRNNITSFRNSIQYMREGVESVSNSEDDILNLVSDMFDRLNGKLSFDVLVSENKIFLEKLLPNHYCYGTSSHLSPRFIRKYLKIFGAVN